ncbi:right-handed parallel beta-helix repeat-containing protein [Sphingobium boeckii]|uniref:Right handed beta helix domain-containing protein n=1 Tax=Sphingobium boeckii TaxID=1082345 RepID=A0A7W9AIL5_9SPHN|nr:right-handed parallel beta-helix repeat-containing protein [Sphingobium boeckii]MBB5686154.1 hypothetical protein [Sphingobium boeckii]
MRIPLAMIGIALLASPLFAENPAAPFTIQQTGQGFQRLSDAVAAIGEGSATILIAAGTYRQCAVQDAGDIRYQAVMPGSAIFDGVACEGKAALVLGGRAATVEGVVFRNIRVADDNGAGIRLERGDLTVRQSMFLNSQQGILTASNPAGRITVEFSTFAGLGLCPEGGSCAHSIYVGTYGALAVRNCRFERGTGGHYVKSRAARIAVTDSSFDDSAGRATNYMIDLPAGATGEISGNVFVQGKDKENYSAFIAVGAEEIEHSSAGLAIRGNTASLASGLDRRTSFVADWSHDSLTLADNVLGKGLKAFETR